MRSPYVTTMLITLLFIGIIFVVGQEKTDLPILDRQNIIEALIALDQRVSLLEQEKQQLRQERIEKRFHKNYAEYNLTAEALYTSATFFCPVKLNSNGYCEIPTIPPSVYPAKLFELPLIIPDNLCVTRYYRVVIHAHIKAITADNDILLGISDGTNVVGYLRLDKDNYPNPNDGIGFFVVCADSQQKGKDGVGINESRQSIKNVAISETIEKFEIVLDITPEGTTIQTKLDAPIISPIASKFTIKLDTNKLWKLVAFGDDPAEKYGFVSVYIKITQLNDN